MSKHDSRPGPAPYEVTRDATAWVIRSGFLVLLLVGIYTTGAGYYLTHVDALPEAPIVYGGERRLPQTAEAMPKSYPYEYAVWAYDTDALSVINRTSNGPALSTLGLSTSTSGTLTLGNGLGTATPPRYYTQVSESGLIVTMPTKSLVTVTLPARCVVGTSLFVNDDTYVCVTVDTWTKKAPR